MTMLESLSAEFPRHAISWRAQSLTRDGDKAMALAYIDARDVMKRLDAVCGPANWQDRYEFSGPRTVCYLSIRIDGEWITKADGAGDTDVEAEKGAISDAFKRAAVKWGIGRYLYDLDAPWVPCRTYESGGKKRWKEWEGDPWNYVRGAQSQPKVSEAKKTSAAEMKRGLETITQELLDCRTPNDAQKIWKAWVDVFKSQQWSKDYIDIARERIQARGRELKEATEAEAVFPGDLNNSHQRPLEMQQ